MLPKRHWSIWSFLFSISLVFCFVLNTWSTGQIGRLAANAFPLSSRGVIHSYVPVVQAGIAAYEAGKFLEAIALWQQALPQIATAKDKATIYSDLALAYRRIGQIDRAIEQWQQAIQVERQQNDAATQSRLAGILTEQAQAYDDLGQHQRAIELLQSALELARHHLASEERGERREEKEKEVEAASLGALGNVYWSLGDYERAQSAHNASLKIARKRNDQKLITTNLNDLGNVYVSWAERYSYQATSAQLEGDTPESIRLRQLAEQNTAAALDAYKQSVQESQALGGLAEVTARINLIRQLERSTTTEREIASNRERVSQLLATEPDSEDKAYALINLALEMGNSEFPLGIRERGGEKGEGGVGY